MNPSASPSVPARPRRSLHRRAIATGVLLAAVLAPGAAHAQALSVTTRLSEATVAVGEIVTLEITVTARISGEIKVEPPSVNGMTRLSTSQSQSSQSISLSASGQQVLVQQVYQIAYRADQPGKHTIGPVKARVGRRRAKSTPVSVTVLSKAAIDARATKPSSGQVAPPDRGEGALFIRYRVDRPEPYLGQMVLLDLEIIAEPNVRFQIDEEALLVPEIDGFWTQQVDAPKQLRRETTRIRGRPYWSYRVWRAALFPLKAGEHVLPTTSMRFVQGGSLFRPGRRLKRRVRPVRLKVKPLPSDGRPSDFVATNVGRYELTAEIDRRRVEAGKAVLLTVRMSGEGNIASAKLPSLDAIDGFRVFAPTVRDEVQKSLNGVSGFKEAEYLLMPQRGGRLTIPAISVSTFDPIAEKYRRLETKPLRVTVVGEPDPSAAPPPPVASAAPALGKPHELVLRPLRFTSDLASTPGPPWRQAWFWVLLLLPAATSGGWAGWQWRRQAEARSAPRSTQRAALRQAHFHLEAARADVEAHRLADAYVKIAEALRGCGSEMLGLSLQGLTFEAVRTQTVARGLDDADAADLVRLLEAADYARYAPGQLTAATGRSDVERAEQLLAAFSTLTGGDK